MKAQDLCPCCGRPKPDEKPEPPSFRAFWSPPRRADGPVRQWTPTPKERPAPVVDISLFSPEQVALLLAAGINPE